MEKRYNEDLLVQESIHQLCNLLHSAAYIPLMTDLLGKVQFEEKYVPV